MIECIMVQLFNIVANYNACNKDKCIIRLYLISKQCMTEYLI